ncbi:MAG: AbrB/MazE/SpoVT family DNA-binding domain-containing protein [Desulfurococcales archaeon]|nr:AbrB/MazE/SpoVT family DNA-binding domain-containing protein [Desulfurococcales archaeon]
MTWFDMFINLSEQINYLRRLMLFRVRVGKRGVIVIPKEVRDRLGIEEGMVLELSVEDGKIVIRVRDLWSELRKRGKKLEIDVDKAERELDEDEELWLKRVE